MTRFHPPGDRVPLDHTGPHRAAPRIGVVLGGGALKGMAHIGALRAIREAGITPTLYAGSSIGAMVAAAAASGRTCDQLQERALRFRRRDLFRINHMGMIMERMLSRSIYLEAPLRALCDELVDEGTFDQFRHPLLVTAVDIERGLPIVFGRPGFRQVPVRDAVYASCALPGFFPPGAVGDRVCIDGGTMDNLPVEIAGLGVDAIIAVDVGIADVPVARGIAEQGFASIFMRAATMMMHEMQQATLDRWTSPPMLLVRPPVSHIGWFSFSHVEELLHIGYESTKAALGHLLEALSATGGIFPRQQMEITVERGRCTGCGLCVAHSPALMALDGEQRAYPLERLHEFSPADGAFARCCPEEAIRVAPAHAADGIAERLAQSA
jgi:NTE family protein